MSSDRHVDHAESRCLVLGSGNGDDARVEHEHDAIPFDVRAPQELTGRSICRA